MRKVEPLPTRDCEAGYGPDFMTSFELIGCFLLEDLLFRINLNETSIVFWTQRVYSSVMPLVSNPNDTPEFHGTLAWVPT